MGFLRWFLIGNYCYQWLERQLETLTRINWDFMVLLYNLREMSHFELNILGLQAIIPFSMPSQVWLTTPFLTSNICNSSKLIL